MPMSSLGELLTNIAANKPDGEALVFGDKRIPWREYASNVNRLAKAFLEFGIQPGDRVGVYSHNCPEYLYIYLAAASIGAILVGFNHVYTIREVLELARKIQPVILVVADSKAREPQVLAKLSDAVDRLLVIGDDALPGIQSLSEIIDRERLDLNQQLAQRMSAVSPDDGALIVITDGSSGLPKGAMLTHRNIIANISAQVSHQGFSDQDRLLLHLPLSHASRATILAIPPLITGSTLVIMDRFHPAATLELIGRERIIVLGQVPTMFIMEFALSNFDQYDLSSLRMTIVAGAPTPAAIMAQLADLTPATIHGYGLTEVAGFATFTDIDDDLDRITSTVGRPMPEIELRIVDDARRLLGSGEVGEIAIQGPYVVIAYFGEGEETNDMIDEKGWLYTGDLGFQNDDGYLKHAGLKKEMLISGGYNVYPREIEEYICGHPKVDLAACVPVDHAILGQVGALFVVSPSNESLTISEIKSYCRDGLANYKVPRIIRRTSELPLSAPGESR